jgi:hypothetical protein
MKKLMACTIALLFLMVAVSAVFATETTFKGDYQVRAWAEYNFAKKPGYIFTPDKDPQYSGWFEQRFRLTITHTRSEFLKAVVKFDLVDDTWGQQRNLRINNTINGSIVDWAYLEFKLPKIGTFTAGKFPQAFGYGLTFASLHPGQDGVKWENTWGPVTLAAISLKIQDNISRGSNDYYYNRDANLWALDLMITPNENHLVELFGGLVTADAGLTAGRFNAMSFDWFGRAGLGGASTLDAAMNLGFVGVRYTGDIANMIAIKAEYSWVLGSLTFNNRLAHTTVLDNSVTVQGWNLYLDAAYYNDLLKVGVAFLMGSGEKHDYGPASIHNINVNNIMWDPSAFTWANIIGNGLIERNPVQTGPGFIGTAENLTSVKLYFQINPMEKLSINAAVIWAKWTDPVGTNPLTSPTAAPAYPHPAAFYNANFGIAPTSWVASTDLGWEIDLGFSYEIMEGLTYSFAGGVLFTGDSWDYVDMDGTRQDWGPIWSIMNTLKYSF